MNDRAIIIVIIVIVASLGFVACGGVVMSCGNTRCVFCRGKQSTSSLSSSDGSLLLFSLLVGSVDLSAGDSIKLGRRVALGEMSCGSTGCLSCRGKQCSACAVLVQC